MRVDASAITAVQTPAPDVPSPSGLETATSPEPVPCAAPEEAKTSANPLPKTEFASSFRTFAAAADGEPFQASGTRWPAIEMSGEMQAGQMPATIVSREEATASSSPRSAQLPALTGTPAWLATSSNVPADNGTIVPGAMSQFELIQFLRTSDNAVDGILRMALSLREINAMLPRELAGLPANAASGAREAGISGSSPEVTVTPSIPLAPSVQTAVTTASATFVGELVPAAQGSKEAGVNGMLDTLTAPRPQAGARIEAGAAWDDCETVVAVQSGWETVAAAPESGAGEEPQPQALDMDLTLSRLGSPMQRHDVFTTVASDAGEGRFLRRRQPGSQPAEPSMRSSRPSDPGRQAALLTALEPVFWTDSPKDESRHESLSRALSAVAPSETHTGKDRLNEGAVAPGNAGQPSTTVSPEAQRYFMHNEAATAGATETMMRTAPRPVLQGSSSESTAWAAGVHPAAPAVTAELKSLAALLAPKPSHATPENDFMSLLAERIQLQLRNGENILRIQLKPAALGRMEIRAENTAAGVLATITTDSAGVKNYLEHNLHLLQQSFQDQGLKVARISVTVLEPADDLQSSGTALRIRPRRSCQVFRMARRLAGTAGRRAIDGHASTGRAQPAQHLPHGCINFPPGKSCFSGHHQRPE
jgi:hypothetical protein